MFFKKKNIFELEKQLKEAKTQNSELKNGINHIKNDLTEIGKIALSNEKELQQIIIALREFYDDETCYAILKRAKEINPEDYLKQYKQFNIQFGITFFME